MALSEAKQNLIRKRIIQGIPLKDIAEEVGCSVRTINNYKKNTPKQIYNQDLDSGDSSLTLDYSAVLTKMEESFTKKLEAHLSLYEDEVEGWCYHLAKSDYRWKTSGTWWSFIVYPESAPQNWIELLRATGLRLAISPLHDKDKWDHDSPEMVDAATGEKIPKGTRYKAGDKKKPHWHCIGVSDKRMSYKEANALIRKCTHGPYIQKCRSLRNAYNYFLHLNHPNKYQGYDKDEIKKYNEFHLEPTKYEVGQMQEEIIRQIMEHQICEMYDLMKHFLGQTEYLAIITAKPGIFTSLVNSIWKKKHPEGKVQRVKIVTEKEERR